MRPDEFEIAACGDDALRVLCGPSDMRYALAQQLSGDASWVDVIPGKADVTVAFNPHKENMSSARKRLEAFLKHVRSTAFVPGQVHVLDAVFGGVDGPDLDRIAAELGLGPSGVVDAIEGSAFKVDMLGFTPGFAYLSGLDEALSSERLAHPRVRVPAGSIGLITGQLGLYALEGPGGWPLVGRLVQTVFDAAQTNPFRLRAGDSVHIRRVRTS